MNQLPPALWWIFAAIVAYFALFTCIVWLRGLEERPPLERELHKASHGVALILCGAYLLHTVTIWQRYWVAVDIAYGCFCLLGIFWFLIGSARAQIYGDARLRTRAAVKFVMGWMFLAIWHYCLPSLSWYWRGWLTPGVMVTCIWCWVTGIVQFIVCSRARRRLRLPPDPPDYQGGARFPGAGGLGGETR